MQMPWASSKMPSPQRSTILPDLSNTRYGCSMRVKTWTLSSESTATPRPGPIASRRDFAPALDQLVLTVADIDVHEWLLCYNPNPSVCPRTLGVNPGASSHAVCRGRAPRLRPPCRELQHIVIDADVTPGEAIAVAGCEEDAEARDRDIG